MSLMTPITLISKESSKRCDAGPLMREKVLIDKGNSSRAHDDPSLKHPDPNAGCRGTILGKAVGNSSFQKERR
jgi:hypothetical protein